MENPSSTLFKANNKTMGKLLLPKVCLWNFTLAFSCTQLLKVPCTEMCRLFCHWGKTWKHTHLKSTSVNILLCTKQS